MCVHATDRCNLRIPPTPPRRSPRSRGHVRQAGTSTLNIVTRYWENKIKRAASFPVAVAPPSLPPPPHGPGAKLRIRYPHFPPPSFFHCSPRIAQVSEFPGRALSDSELCACRIKSGLFRGIFLEFSRGVRDGRGGGGEGRDGGRPGESPRRIKKIADEKRLARPLSGFFDLAM